MPEKLKKGWTRVAFGDVVQLCRERSSDPTEDGFDRYVGLEHLEPGDLKIRRWGNVADGTTFTNVFRAGQVLFGKRRAYQRKVAVADFDGVCSGDIYVLEAKGDRLLPELLPFICQTDRFFEHAVGTSAGSLSPRTNWESLAGYEFALPPLEEQRRIAEVLGAGDETIKSMDEGVRQGERLYSALLVAVFGPHVSAAKSGCVQKARAKGKSWTWHRVDELFDLQLGKMSSKKAREGKDQTSYIKNNNVLWGAFELNDLPTMSFSSTERQKFSLQEGDLIVCEGGEIGRAAIWRSVDREIVYQKALHRLRPLDRRALPGFFLHYLRYCALFGILEKIATGTTLLHLPQERLAELLLPFPVPSEQEDCIRSFEDVRSGVVQLQARGKAARAFKAKLLEEVVAP